MRQVEIRVLKNMVNAMLVGWIDAIKMHNKDITIIKAIDDFMERYNLDEEMFTQENLCRMYYKWKNDTLKK
jgi:2-phospho-L-lactate guanylyltransferase (CobY/MobA/RfbA family)